MSQTSEPVGAAPAATGPESGIDPGALMRSRQYRGLLVVSALIGVVVSIASWGFLQVTHELQKAVYVDLPDGLGFDSVPWWWPLPVLAVAGLLIAFAVVRLPGRGGHEPSDGLHTGPPTTPVEVPGLVLAAVASIGLGLVLGPEAPLIGLGAGVALFLVDRTKRPFPDQARLIIAAAAGFAALATIFGSPVIGALIIIEAAGLGGPTLPLILMPGLLAAGIGSLVFVGIDKLTGLSTDAYALPPLELPAYAVPKVVDFLWTLPLALAAAVVVFASVELGRQTRRLVSRQPFILFPAAALLIGLLAIAFAEISGQSADAVLFSGQEAMSSVIQQAANLSLATLALLLVAKALAWGLSLGAARGGPTFPAIFLGVVGGLLTSHLPGLAETPAIGVLVGAAVVSVLKLPLSAIVLALLITRAGAGVAPLIIVGVVAAYIGTLVLEARTRRDPTPTPHVPEPSPAPAADAR